VRLATVLPLSAIALAHALPLTVLLTGVRDRDLVAFGLVYFLIPLAVGIGLHRYFAHRAFKTSRGFQFFLALLAAAFFGDALGFAGKHRLHHRHADTERDVHSPRWGVWQCWIGHFLEERYTEAEVLHAARDFARYPELLWLHRHYYLPGMLLVGAVLGFGGYSMLAGGFAPAWCLMGIHGPALVNYFGHGYGRRRFETSDRSTNNAVLGVLLLGEGWHNNHHRHPGAATAGIEWYELDLLYWALRALALLGLVWDLREIPGARAESRRRAECVSR
jgi:stearoyl-CoA desaturase (delta-9 desaturase)